MKTFGALAIAPLFALFLFAAPALCGEAVYSLTAGITSLDDLNGRNVGVIRDTTYVGVVKKRYPNATETPFATHDESVRALLAGEIDAFVTDEPFAFAEAARHKELRVVEGLLDPRDYGYAVRFYHDDLLKELNDGLDALREDGVLADAVDRWLKGGGGTMPDIEEANYGPALHIGVADGFPPFVFRDDDGELAGFDIELLRRLAEKMGRKPVFEVMTFAELIPSLRSGATDLAGTAFYITPERKELVQFTIPYHKGGGAVLTRSGRR